MSDSSTHGVRHRWLWVNPSYVSHLPSGFLDRIADIHPDDRHHAKQGRSTGRLRIDSAAGSVSVYLKRHQKWPATSRLMARLRANRPWSPAGEEWRNLEAARRLGIAVPDTIAAGEQLDRYGRPQSFLIVREIDGEELHLALPRLERRLGLEEFARIKRKLVRALAELVARLHRRQFFHKDLYLCHIFLENDASLPIARRLTLIDLQRLAQHRWTRWRWRWKDLGQLLYSTFGVAGIDDRDRLRFWKHYRRAVGLRHERVERMAVRAKAVRYHAHNYAGG